MIINKNAFYAAISMGSNLIIPLAAFPFLIRALGEHEFGELAIVLVVVTLLCQLVDFGFLITGAREVSREKNVKKLIAVYSKIQNTRLFLGLVALMIMSLLAVTNVLPINSALLLITAVPAIIGTVIQSVWFYQGQGYFGWLALANFTSKLSFLLGSIFLVHDSTDCMIAGLLHGWMYLFGGLILYVILYRKEIKWRLRFKSLQVFTVISGSWRPFISTGLLGFHTQAIVAMTGVFISPAAAGLLLTADRIIRAVSMITAPLTSSLFPVMSKLYKLKDPAVHEVRRRLVFMLSVLGVFLGSALYLSADVVANLIKSGSTGELADYLKIGAILPPVAAIGVVYGGLTLVPAGFDSDYMQNIAMAELLAALTFFGLVLFGSELAGLFAILVAEVSIAMLMTLKAQRRLITNV